MNRNAKKWVAALRSGKYKRGTGQLAIFANRQQSRIKYCCLGVACELAHQAGIVSKEVSPCGRLVYAGNDSYLPPVVRDWLGLKDKEGGYGPHKPWIETTLARLNDAGKTFTYIADVIEKEPPGLFEKKQTAAPARRKAQRSG